MPTVTHTTTHRWVKEQRTRRHAFPWGDVVTLTRIRWQCSCGWSTRWHHRHDHADHERDQHTGEGQVGWQL